MLISQGFYRHPRTGAVPIAKSVQLAVEATRCYVPADLGWLLTDLPSRATRPPARFEVTGETSLQAARRLSTQARGTVGVLNFASATKPGGGYLTGATAQEEDMLQSPGHLLTCGPRVPGPRERTASPPIPGDVPKLPGAQRGEDRTRHARSAGSDSPRIDREGGDDPGRGVPPRCPSPGAWCLGVWRIPQRAKRRGSCIQNTSHQRRPILRAFRAHHLRGARQNTTTLQPDRVQIDVREAIISKPEDAAKSALLLQKALDSTATRARSGTLGSRLVALRCHTAIAVMYEHFETLIHNGCAAWRS